jgi:hypothetical protein
VVTNKMNKKTTKKSAEKGREPERRKATVREMKRGREAIDPPRKKPIRTKDEGAVKPRTAQGRKPTREEIARRAYDIWMSQGRPYGVETENWLSAEQELILESVD